MKRITNDLFESIRQVTSMQLDEAKKLDPVGKEDADINNDKKVDSTDQYLKNRRDKIAASIKEEEGIDEAKKKEKEEKMETCEEESVAEGSLGTSSDKLLARTGINIAHKVPRPGQTDKRDIPAGNLNDKHKAYMDQQRAERPAKLKAAIKSHLGKHHTPNLPEEVEQLETNSLIENIEVINEVSLGAKIKAYVHHSTSAMEYGDRGYDEESERHEKKAEKIMSHIKKHHGSEAADHAEKAASASIFGRGGHSPGSDSLSGGLRNVHSKAVTKSGKLSKGTQSAIVHQRKTYGSRITGPKGHLPEEVEQVDEASYSATAARAGKDIGKKGKMFGQIAASAGARYGSAAKGKKVAGKILANLRAKHMKEEVELTEGITETIVKHNDFTIEVTDNPTFADFLKAVQTIVPVQEEADQAEVIAAAAEAYEENNIDVIIEAFTRADINDKISAHKKAGNTVTGDKFTVKDGKPYAEYVVTDSEGNRKKYIHHGTARRMESMPGKSK